MFTGFEELSAPGVAFAAYFLFSVFPFSVSCLVRDELIRVVVMDGNTHS